MWKRSRTVSEPLPCLYTPRSRTIKSPLGKIPRVGAVRFIVIHIKSPLGKIPRVGAVRFIVNHSKISL